ncbi:MAG: DNA repair protein RadC [Flavobacteriales bacterium]|nr:DNA repair protein RadC [Flavobacteriales bacterium]
MEISNTIKNWNLDDRPREKLINKGASVLSNAELMAIILGSGSRSESAVGLAKRILQKADNNFAKLSRMQIEDFKQFKGVGEAKAVSLSATFEFARRRKEEVDVVTKIGSSSDIFKEMSSNLSDLNHEEFWVVFLNRGNRIIKKERISSGGITGTVVDNKIILKKALLHLASSVILVHNHPSGNLKPSPQDHKVTQKIKSACELLEINLLDHLIIAGNSYYSFADELDL